MSKKLLVADDSLTIQKVIRLALSNEGYEIEAISDGGEFMQHLTLFRPDAVLIDVALPTRNAFDLRQDTASHPEFRSVKFILMSSAFEKVDESRASQLGFDGRLTKPFDPAHLRQVIAGALASQAGAEKTNPAFTPAPASGGASELTLDFDRPIQPDMPTLDLGHDGAPDADIRKLTESTFMIGQSTQPDGFEWSMNEPGAAKKPTLAPPASVPLAGEDTRLNLMRQEQTIKPPSGLADLSGTNFEFETAPASFGEKFEGLDITPPPPPNLAPPVTRAATPPPSSDPSVLPLTTGQMEEVMRKQLQETIEQMARKALPEIAEKIIKQEIHRLLSEQI